MDSLWFYRHYAVFSFDAQSRLLMGCDYGRTLPKIRYG